MKSTHRRFAADAPVGLSWASCAVAAMMAFALAISALPTKVFAQQPVSQATQGTRLDPSDPTGSAKFFKVDPKNFELTDISKEMAQTEFAPESLCVRTPIGPGRVYWTMANPRGAGYSVKPEASSSLIWAQPPTQGIDGIYRSSWSDCNAVKVPDHCTVDWYSNDTYYECCNLAASQLLGRSQPVNTCQLSDWPDQPLR